MIKDKCEGCKRAEGSDSIFTCNCNVISLEEISAEVTIEMFLSSIDMLSLDNAIKCAIIHVNGIIENSIPKRLTLHITGLKDLEINKTTEYWKKVKQILENK